MIGPRGAGRERIAGWGFTARCLRAGPTASVRVSAWRFCFIGGLAVQHWGEPRATRDLDIALFAGFGQEAGVVDGLLALYPPRRPDARDFALRHRVLLLATPTGTPIDLALAGLPFESEMIDRAVEVEFLPGVSRFSCAL